MYKNPFDILIDDIFSAPDFVEYCTINNKKIACISSEISVDENFTEFGIDDGITFFLRVKKESYQPKKSDLILFRNETYKVDTFTIDSTSRSYNIYLKSVSTK